MSEGLIINIKHERQPDLSGIESPIALGDQSPNAGGLLRLYVGNLLGLPLIYYHHNTDSSWVNSGGGEGKGGKLKIVGGFQRYWSTASRNPLTFYGFSDETDIHQGVIGFANSIGAPSGLLTLHGPNTQDTFYSAELSENPELRERSIEMLLEEVGWAIRIARMIEHERGITLGNEIERFLRSLQEDGNIRHIGDASASFYTEFVDSNGRDMSSSLEIFRNQSGFLMSLPEDMDLSFMYWKIDPNTGKRFPAGIKGRDTSNKILVPKAHMLPIELAVRGYIVGISSMSYAREVAALRDAVAPGLKIPILQFRFDMEIPEDLFRRQLIEFNLKRIKKGKPAIEYEEIFQILQKWRSRPTPILALIVGVIPIGCEVIYYPDIIDYIASL